MYFVTQTYMSIFPLLSRFPCADLFPTMSCFFLEFQFVGISSRWEWPAFSSEISREKKLNMCCLHLSSLTADSMKSFIIFFPYFKPRECILITLTILSRSCYTFNQFSAQHEARKIWILQLWLVVSIETSCLPVGQNLWRDSRWAVL